MWNSAPAPNTYADPMDSGLRSGRFVAWGNAVLAGLVSPDAAAERITGADRPHRVLGATLLAPSLTALDDPVTGVSLPVLLAGLRPAGVQALVLALPVPGDPSGLPGPPEFNARAIHFGEAVLTVGGAPCGLLPEHIAEDPDGVPGPGALWRVEPVAVRAALDLPSLAEAERELAETMRTATEALDALEVARWRPEAADRLDAIRANTGGECLAPGYPARAHRVLALAQRVNAIAELAADDSGAAYDVRGITGRAAELRPLARAARRAQIAAYNAMIESRV